MTHHPVDGRQSFKRSRRVAGKGAGSGPHWLVGLLSALAVSASQSAAQQGGAQPGTNGNAKPEDKAAANGDAKGSSEAVKGSSDAAKGSSDTAKGSSEA